MANEPFYEDPAKDQSPEEIEKFMRSLKEGDEVAIHNAQGGGGLLSIHIAKVSEVRPRGRLWTDRSGDFGADNRWFMKSGKNCGAPTGQSRLVIPTDEVRRYAQERRFALDHRPLDASSMTRAIKEDQ